MVSSEAAVVVEAVASVVVVVVVNGCVVVVVVVVVNGCVVVVVVLLVNVASEFSAVETQVITVGAVVFNPSVGVWITSNTISPVDLRIWLTLSQGK